MTIERRKSPLILDIIAAPMAWKSPADGKWHPAVRQHGRIYYWPNIASKSQEKAQERAEELLDAAKQALEEATSDWNCWELPVASDLAEAQGGAR
jgi:hypothetical protein